MDARRAVLRHCQSQSRHLWSSRHGPILWQQKCQVRELHQEAQSVGLQAHHYPGFRRGRRVLPPPLPAGQSRPMHQDEGRRWTPCHRRGAAGCRRGRHRPPPGSGLGGDDLGPDLPAPGRAGEGTGDEEGWACRSSLQEEGRQKESGSTLGCFDPCRYAFYCSGKHGNCHRRICWACAHCRCLIDARCWSYCRCTPRISFAGCQRGSQGTNRRA